MRKFAQMRGALAFSAKAAVTAMTPLQKVFMVSEDAPLDDTTLRAIVDSGHSRIPVHVTGDRCVPANRTWQFGSAMYEVWRRPP
jgi:CBS domain containing-hemolysin-like protein